MHCDEADLQELTGSLHFACCRRGKLIKYHVFKLYSVENDLKKRFDTALLFSYWGFSCISSFHSLSFPFDSNHLFARRKRLSFIVAQT